MFAYVLPVAVFNPQLPSWIAATETFWPTKLWLFSIWSYTVVGFLRWLSGKESGEADMGSIPGWGRSPGGGSGNPLQYSCLENPKDRGVWWAMVHGFAESNTPERLTHTHTIAWQFCVGFCLTATWISRKYCPAHTNDTVHFEVLGKS